MTVPAVTSALQRARATIADKRPPNTPPSPYEQQLLAGFIDAHERMDAEASLAMVREDIRITMPPDSMLFEGRAQMRRLFGLAREMGEWRLIPAWVNRMPAAVSYLKRPGDTAVPPVQGRRTAGRRRSDRRDDHVRRAAGGLDRPARDADRIGVAPCPAFSSPGARRRIGRAIALKRYDINHFACF